MDIATSQSYLVDLSDWRLIPRAKMAGAVAIFDSQDALYVSQTENVYSWVRQLMDSTKPHHVRAAIAKRFFGSSHEISADTMDDRVAAFLEGCSAGVFLANNRNEAIALKSQLIEQLSPRLQEKTKATRPLNQTRAKKETDKIRELLSRVGKLSHLDDTGRPRMVDVTAKAETAREATASGSVSMSAETLALATSGRVAKGDVLTTARLAGIMAAKRTHELIPLCHPLPLTAIEVDLTTDEARSAIYITATVRTTAKTGVEMEALTAVTIAALTVYDMLKAAQKDIIIGDIRLLRKTGGKSGDWISDLGETLPDAGLDSVRLSTGTVVGNCEEKVAQFCAEDHSYRHYDAAQVAADNSVTEMQVRVANKLIARMGPSGVKRFLDAGNCISEALSRIPAAANLESDWSDSVAEAFRDLLGCVVGPGIGIARATKVFHKKRPSLIPILDNEVVRYCARAIQQASQKLPSGEVDKAVVAIQVLRSDMIANSSVLHSLSEKYGLTPLRVLDIIIWAWSGQYTPVWTKGGHVSRRLGVDA